MLKEEISIYNDPVNKEISLNIEKITKSLKGNFIIYFNIKNTTDKPINYKLEKAFFATEKGEQIKADIVRLIEIGSTDNDVIFPKLYVKRNVSFYNDFSDFSENDLFFCSILVNNVRYALGATLGGSGIKKVSLD